MSTRSLYETMLCSCFLNIASPHLWVLLLLWCQYCPLSYWFLASSPDEGTLQLVLCKTMPPIMRPEIEAEGHYYVLKDDGKYGRRF